MPSLGSVSGVSLMEGEEVLHDQSKRWRDYPLWTTIGIVGVFAAGLGLVVLAWIWWRKSRSRLIVTSERVIEKRSSLLSVKSQEYPIREIDQLQTSGKRLDVVGAKHGTIEFSVGGGGELVQLTNTRHYKEIANTIREQQRRIASA